MNLYTVQSLEVVVVAAVAFGLISVLDLRYLGWSTPLRVIAWSIPLLLVLFALASASNRHNPGFALTTGFAIAQIQLLGSALVLFVAGRVMATVERVKYGPRPAPVYDKDGYIVG